MYVNIYINIKVCKFCRYIFKYIIQFIQFNELDKRKKSTL